MKDMKKQNFGKGEIVIYKTSKNEVVLDVQMRDETVWLTQKQMAALFSKGVPTINEHIKNIYNDGELKKESTIRKFRVVYIKRVKDNPTSSILEHTTVNI